MFLYELKYVCFVSVQDLRSALTSESDVGAGAGGESVLHQSQQMQKQWTEQWRDVEEEKRGNALVTMTLQLHEEEHQSQANPRAPPTLLCTPNKSHEVKGKKQQYRYLDTDENDNVSDSDETSLTPDRNTTEQGRERETAPHTVISTSLVTPPESRAVRALASSYPPHPSFLRKNLLSASQQMQCMQALCEADLRAVISGHEDLAERQQSLLEDLHARLLHANEAAEFEKLVASKVSGGCINLCLNVTYYIYIYFHTIRHYFILCWFS